MIAHRRAGTLLALVPILLVAGCLGGTTPEAADVMVTHEPLRYLAAGIAGDNVTVDVLVEGVDAHHFEPGLDHAQLVADAGLVVRQGAGFDTWLGDLLDNLGSDAPPHVAVADDPDLELIVHHGHAGHGHDDVDPHTWTDPLRMVEHARLVEEAMADRWPQHAPAFHARADALVAELRVLDAAYRDGLANCTTRTNVVSHDAFAYLGARYNLTFHAVHGLGAGVEPSAATLDRLRDVMREENVTTVFFEEHVDPQVARTLARETGARTDVLSPAATGGANATYLTKMQGNLDALRTAMRCT